MASTSLSLEDENYVRMSLLLTGISPRAVRKLFDREFAPSCLDASIKKEYNTLNDLKLKHRINQSQWNLLFPRHPDVPNSKSFDITLMITLLRNLTAMEPPQFGYEKLPTSIEITQAADLCRIKYYRNYFAHLDQGKIDTACFQISWTDMTGAINRLGGEQMKLECDQLKTKPLDQTNQEIMMDIKRSYNEIRELRGSLENLKLSCIEMKKCNAILNENHEEVKKSFELLNEKVTTLNQDTVPWNIRAQIVKTLGKWKDRDSIL
ncbi:unnamed protein product [Mytilus edulis]|uniref:DZIP3-like HEPN domain-containing protein n=1 Tax=Mytilus edulis TaxID=6550 RepID=A0A8S3SPS2_MYTED|nr:unnamed protein product [Mytilus edulis]